MKIIARNLLIFTMLVFSTQVLAGPESDEDPFIEPSLNEEKCVPWNSTYSWHNSDHNIVSADFDHNGYDDIAVAGDEGLYIRLNQATRDKVENAIIYSYEEHPLTFISPKIGYCNYGGEDEQVFVPWGDNVSVAFGFRKPKQYFVADYNEDGFNDILIKSGYSWIIKKGSGIGTFEEKLFKPEWDFYIEDEDTIFMDKYYSGGMAINYVTPEGVWNIDLERFYWSIDSVKDPVYLVTDNNGDGITDIGIYDAEKKILYIRHAKRSKIDSEDDYGHVKCSIFRA